MKGRIEKHSKPQPFEPFTLSIDVETLDEARFLYHITNLGCYLWDKIKGICTNGSRVPFPKTCHSFSGVWSAINNELKGQSND